MSQRFSPREMLSSLVAFPTVSDRSNLDLISFVEDYLHGHDIPTRRVPDATGEKSSLLALIGPEVEGGVVLSGHTDVVPVAGQDWSTDPFTVTERDGRLFGRGTCDMKGFLACGLALAPQMRAADLKRPILLALSYDEEIGCLGAPPMIERMLADLPRPEAVIVGEPSLMQVVTGHKASWGMEVNVRGHEVHSSLIHTGVSAVMTAARLVAWMDAAMAENRRTAGPNEFEPPWTTLHAGMISGGTAGNITARDCRFIGEIRIVPGETVTEWRTRFMDEVARLEAEIRAVHPDASISVRTRMELAGFEPETDGPAETLARGLTGDNVRRVVAYQTEAGQFQEKGLSTVICGPGSIEQAHQPNEFISLDQLDAGTEFVHRLIQRLAA